MSLNIPLVLDRLNYRYPSLLVDAVVEHEPGERLVAVKNVTVNEEYFQGHFPGTPLMPGVMMIETLVQVAALLLLYENGEFPNRRAELLGVNNARFRRQVVPGDRLRLEVTLERRLKELAVARAVATVEGRTVAEAELLVGLDDSVERFDPMAIMRSNPEAIAGERVVDEAEFPVDLNDETGGVDPMAIVHSGAVIGPGTVVGPYAVIGSNVRIGRGCRIGASAVVDGETEIGDNCQVFPFASVGLIPQDLKFQGENTRLVIGNRNVFREFVTINRGTRGGGGVTLIGNANVFMAYAHVAHDCIVGSDTIFGNGATLGGHVVVEDNATISAFSGVHQFCRVGRQAFIGGYSVVTMDALPYGKTVGNRARIYGLNTIGLERRGVPRHTIAKLKHAYRYLLQSKLNTTQALERITADETLACSEVSYLVEFIRTSTRGVNLRRPPRRVDPVGVEE